MGDMGNMEHDARYCGLCKANNYDQLFAAQLLLWLEPVLNIDQDLNLPIGCAENHFAAINDGAFLRCRKNLEHTDQNWPSFENALALFAPAGPGGPYTRLNRLVMQLEGASKIDKFAKAVSAVAEFLAGDGCQWVIPYAIATNVARNYADSFDFSKMEFSEKRKLFGVAQNHLPGEELRVPEMVRRYGNVAVTLGMIFRSANPTFSGDPDFSEQSVEQYLNSQVWKWISLRLRVEWFHLMVTDARPSDRDFFVLSLGDLIEETRRHAPAATRPTAAAPPLGGLTTAALKSLERKLPKLIRPPTSKRGPIKSMKQLMSKSNYLGVHYENPALYERLLEEIPVGIASMLFKQRRRIKTADELIEALHAGKMGLVWNETRDRLQDVSRRETAAKRIPPILVELEEMTTRGEDGEELKADLKHPTASADGLVREQDSQRLLAKVLETLGDDLDRLIAVRVFQFQVFGGKPPKNAEIAREWESTKGQKITGQAIGVRRNNVELAICAARLSLKDHL